MTPSPRLSLLIDADEFWPSLEQDILRATERVWLQTLSFEGDSVGQRLTALLAGLQGVEVRLLVDTFTKLVINDRYLLSPLNLLDASLRREVAATREMMSTLAHHGVQVRYTNPVGTLFRDVLARNHKKGIIIDRSVVYIGGINFAEHNFAWHDLMLRIEDAEIAAGLADDFSETWEGTNRPGECHSQDVTVHSLDGYSNKDGFRAIEALLDAAQQSVFIHSPYLSFPICDSLRAARQRGVSITVITPQQNNLGILHHYITSEAYRSRFRLLFYPQRMSHLKAMLIDESHLILGSSNFDCLGYALYQETLLILTDPALITEFHQRVITVDVAASLPADPPPWLTRQSYPLLRFGLTLFVHLAALVRHKPPQPEPPRVVVTLSDQG